MHKVILAGVLVFICGCSNASSGGSPSGCACPAGYTVLSCSGGQSECASVVEGGGAEAGADAGASADAGEAILDAMAMPDNTVTPVTDGSSGDGEAIAEAGDAGQEAGLPCGDINENCCWGNLCHSAGLWCIYSDYYGVPRCVDSSTASGVGLPECGQSGEQCCPLSEGGNCSSGYQCYTWAMPDAGYPTVSSQCEPSSGCTLAGASESTTSICSTYYGSPATGAAFNCYGGSVPSGTACRQIDEGAGLGATPGPEPWCCQSSPTCTVAGRVLADCADGGSEQICSFDAEPPSAAHCAASTYSPTYGSATIADYCCN